MKAEDEDGGIWGVLRYSISGDGTNPFIENATTNLNLQHSSHTNFHLKDEENRNYPSSLHPVPKQKNQDEKFSQERRRIGGTSQPDLRGQVTANEGKYEMRAGHSNSEGTGDEVPAFTVDPSSGVISVWKVSKQYMCTLRLYASLKLAFVLKYLLLPLRLY